VVPPAFAILCRLDEIGFSFYKETPQIRCNGRSRSSYGQMKQGFLFYLYPCEDNWPIWPAEGISRKLPATFQLSAALWKALLATYLRACYLRIELLGIIPEV
jgi:hypothetical protein